MNKVVFLRSGRTICVVSVTKMDTFQPIIQFIKCLWGAVPIHCFPKIFFYMSTLTIRLARYRKQPENLHLPALTAQQRMELGSRIIRKYYAQKDPELAVFYGREVGETGTFRVITYPNSFNPDIDQMIRDFYKEIPPPKVRKRIQVRKTPVFTFKPA